MAKECRYAHNSVDLLYTGDAECLAPELKKWVNSGVNYKTMNLTYNSIGGNGGGGTSAYCRGEGRIGYGSASRAAFCAIDGTDVWYK